MARMGFQQRDQSSGLPLPELVISSDHAVAFQVRLNLLFQLRRFTSNALLPPFTENVFRKAIIRAEVCWPRSTNHRHAINSGGYLHPS